MTVHSSGALAIACLLGLGAACTGSEGGNAVGEPPESGAEETHGRELSGDADIDPEEGGAAGAGDVSVADATPGRDASDAAAVVDADSLADGDEPPMPADAERPDSAIQQVVILKLDDLRGDANRVQFAQVLEILLAKKVKASFGIIASGYADDGTKQDLYAWTREVAATGAVEFWNHGLTHNRATDGSSAEFDNQPLAYQTDHLKAAQDLLRTTCGLTMHAFGAPFNQNDATTIDAMKAVPDLEVWMFPKLTTAPQFLLTQRVNMEVDTGVLDEAFFEKNYAANASAPYMVLQGHPPFWDAGELAAFAKLIDFLLARGARFMTPSEYHAYVMASGK
jgi:peptidoglycan/xylan/chitin deacetylase (PgdA/CDA1 family)